MNNGKHRRFVVLDRDGTIIAERNYLSHPEQVELIPRAVEGLVQLSAMGMGLVVITNQSGIARGYFDEARLEQVHQRLREMLALSGVFLDGIYHCPHQPDDRCICRKPLTGLVDRAAAQLGFDPSECFVVGDKPCDVELGQRIGAKTLLVRTGYGAKVEACRAVEPDYVVNDIRDAARVIGKFVSRNRRMVQLGIML